MHAQAAGASQLDGRLPDAAAGAKDEQRRTRHQSQQFERLERRHGADRDGRSLDVVERRWCWTAGIGGDVHARSPGPDDPRVGDDAIADRKALGVGTDFGDPACQLRAHHERRLQVDEPNKATRGDTHVPGADADGGDLDGRGPSGAPGISISSVAGGSS